MADEYINSTGVATIRDWIKLNYIAKSALVTSVSSASTNAQVPSAKLFYDTVGDIESVLEALL